MSDSTMPLLYFTISPKEQHFTYQVTDDKGNVVRRGRGQTEGHATYNARKFIYDKVGEYFAMKDFTAQKAKTTKN